MSMWADDDIIYHARQDSGWHRMDGPAIIYAGGREQWFVRDVEITDQVREWIEDCSINPDWKNWGALEKALFRLRF